LPENQDEGAGEKIMKPCPYCESPEAHGVLPAKDITFDRNAVDHGTGDYSDLPRITSTVHPVLDSNRLAKSIRCWNDVHHLKRRELIAKQEVERKALDRQKITAFEAEGLSHK
jgi:hypothetical protein